MSILFTKTGLGPLALQNHLVMAPMTRSRATGNIPNSLMMVYYAQRGEAGLIVTEGTSPSPNGLGYPRIPGIFSPAQVEGWRCITDAVHDKGAKIFVQLMHCGRIAHPLNLPEDARLLAPSAVAATGEMYTDAEGLQPHPVPQAMTEGDIESTIAEFARAAENAVSAGFDGVELHGANGYLLEQFIRPNTNQRDDGYGGPIENRARFVLEAAEAVVNAIGRDRVGIRLSPFGVFNDMPLYDQIEEDYTYLAHQLNSLGLVYIHLVDHSAMGAPPVPDTIKATFRKLFRRTLILSGGYDAERAENDLTAGRCDLIAVGRPFLANPDLVTRWRTGAAVNEPDMDTFYTPGPRGYTDYPALPGRIKREEGSGKQGKTPTGIYSFMDVVAREAEEYAAEHTSPMSALLEEIEQFTLTNTPYPSMLTGRVQGRFLQLVVQLSGARNILDIGTFTGYSALAMAEALSHDGRILTIEHNPEHARIAQDFFNRSTSSDRITLRQGEALEILKTLPDGQIDLVFIDADKRNYIGYYEESMRIVRNGGLILADNALWYGRIFNPQDDDSRAVAAFNERVNADNRAKKLFLTIRDGVYLIRKKE